MRTRHRDVGAAAEQNDSRRQVPDRLLRRLIRNLLENALKHGGREVAADLSIDRRGTRIPAGQRSRAGHSRSGTRADFRTLLPARPHQRTRNGWGLGLALVKQLSEYHKGSVRCLPRNGGGCIFELTLPVLRETKPG